eukprot:TRINITY_DN16975_c0_g1_i1.p1 TRINITY_DN16975_c0_g1~~TRINITY_DN16975_c0_g1_i1.p1  ORF type:complete len:203 (+),score=-2.64 TRINITY_DN16975_c0_g1_i1:181-789(+)
MRGWNRQPSYPLYVFFHFSFSDVDFYYCPYCSIVNTSSGIISHRSLYTIQKKCLDAAKNPQRNFLIRIPAKFLVKIYELIQSTRKIFSDKKCVIRLIIFTLLFQLLGIVGYYLVIQSAHVNISFTVAFAILTITFLVGIVSMIPGGLGASDLSLIVLLASQGVALPVATNIVLLFRIAMYLPIVLVIGLYAIQTKILARKKA